MGFGSLALRYRAVYENAKANLQGFVAPPVGANSPARDLSPQQARDLVLHYWVNGFVGFEDLPTFDSTGKVLTPKVGSKVRLRLEDIAGVKFVSDSKAARTWTFTNGLQMRNVVMVVRFAEFLKREWGATVIYWGGLGAGRDEGDRHVEGWAMDFHGAETPAGKFDVYRDWGAKRVPAAIGGNSDGEWPLSATRTSFRLATNPLDLRNFILGAITREFFEDCYKFATQQANHHSNESVPRIGEGSSVLHPDTPYGKYRKGHVNHIHFDVL